MASTARGMAVRLTTVAAIATLGLVGLAGCKDTAHPTASATPSASSPSSSASASATPDATPSDAPSRAAGTPIGVDCDGLISRQQMYDFNPNFSLRSGFKPKAGSGASTALSYQGIACSWVNQTSGATIDFGVAHPAASDLAALKASAASGTAVSGIGDSAWFSTSGDTGQLQIFRGPDWITASSVFFGAPDDAKQLALDAVAAVK